MYYFVFTFLSVVCFIVLLYAGVVLLGVSEFKWKAPSLPPMQNARDADQEAKKVDEFLASTYGEKFAVRCVNGRFHVSTTLDCPLPDETILNSLTSKFPRFVFRVSHSLFDSESH